jgi:hypothetical protein
MSAFKVENRGESGHRLVHCTFPLFGVKRFDLIPVQLDSLDRDKAGRKVEFLSGEGPKLEPLVDAAGLRFVLACHF